MELISIIVPVYNRENVVVSCAQSLLAQTYTNLEIIFSDDGSEDGTLNLLYDLARQDERIRIIENQHGGPSSARNAALVTAKGEYIGFLDSDDMIASDMIERMHKNLCRTDADLACCRFRIESNTKKPFETENGTSCVLPPWQAFERMLFLESEHIGYGVSPGTKLCRREVVMQPTTILFDEAVWYGEDAMWLSKVLERCKCVVLDSSVMMRYNIVCKNSICLNTHAARRLVCTKWKIKCLKEHGCSEETIHLMEQEEQALIISLLLGK